MPGFRAFIGVPQISRRCPAQRDIFGPLGTVPHVPLWVWGRGSWPCSLEGCIGVDRPDHGSAVGGRHNTDPNQTLGLGGLAVAPKLLSAAFLALFLRLAARLEGFVKVLAHIFAIARSRRRRMRAV